MAPDMGHTTLTRRSFVQGSAAFFGVGLFDVRAGVFTPRRSPNEEIRVAVVGVRSRGNDHVRGYWNVPNVRVVAICDVDREILARRTAEYDAAGHPVETVVDLRRLLEREDIDVISLATPNHQHALQAIWACQAGKDVYVEKPVSHNIWEGRQLVRAARKYERIVMTGTQCRSSDGIREGLEWTRAGGLGAIQLARGLCYKPRPSIGKVSAPQTVPETIDYDLWLGPAARTPLMRKQLHYDWHWDFQTGNGDLGNQGIHQMDICRWALGEQGLPLAATSVGGRLGYDDDGDTPNSQMILLEYERAPLLFEVRGLPRDAATQSSGWNGAGMDDYMGARIGVIVHCEGGHVLIPNYDTAIAFDRDGKQVQRWRSASDHYAHFIDVVRSRRVADQRADIEQGHVSSAMCHMGNVSHRLGAAADPDAIEASLGSRAEAAEAWARLRAHLGANAVDLGATPVTLGPRLIFDPAGERFADERANALLAREYREPFVVPAQV